MGDYPIIALVDGHVQRFSGVEQIPGDAELLCESREDLEDLSFEELVEKFPFESTAKNKKDHIEHLERLLGSMPINDEVEEEDVDAEKMDGKRRYVRRNKPTYVILPPSKKSLEAMNKLPPQAKALCHILSMSESDELTEDQMKSLVHDNRGMLKSKQNSWRIMQYYRHLLIRGDVIRQK